MRERLGTAALLALLTLTAGCGGDDETSAEDPAGDTASVEQTEAPPEASATGGPDAPVVLLHATAAGGTVGDVLTVVTTDAELAAWTSQLTSAPFVAEVRAAVEDARRDAGDGATVLAGVVAVGCDQPDSATLQTTPAGVAAVLGETGPEVQCLAPVTTVAVAAAPAGS